MVHCVLKCHGAAMIHKLRRIARSLRVHGGSSVAYMVGMLHAV